jgi:hypothetical protein
MEMKLHTSLNSVPMHLYVVPWKYMEAWRWSFTLPKTQYPCAYMWCRGSIWRHGDEASHFLKLSTHALICGAVEVYGGMEMKLHTSLNSLPMCLYVVPWKYMEAWRWSFTETSHWQLKAKQYDVTKVTIMA